MVGSEFLWPGRLHERLHISTRQYARIVREWVLSIGLEVTAYGTQSMRRTKVTQIYKKTGNLRAVHLLLGRTKLGSTVRYLGVERKMPSRSLKLLKSNKLGLSSLADLSCRLTDPQIAALRPVNAAVRCASSVQADFQDGSAASALPRFITFATDLSFLVLVFVFTKLQNEREQCYAASIERALEGIQYARAGR